MHLLPDHLRSLRVGVTGARRLHERIFCSLECAAKLMSALPNAKCPLSEYLPTPWRIIRGSTRYPWIASSLRSSQ
jgi:hypothetical protein